MWLISSHSGALHIIKLKAPLKLKWLSEQESGSPRSSLKTQLERKRPQLPPSDRKKPVNVEEPQWTRNSRNAGVSVHIGILRRSHQLASIVVVPSWSAGEKSNYIKVPRTNNSLNKKIKATKLRTFTPTMLDGNSWLKKVAFKHFSLEKKALLNNFLKKQLIIKIYFYSNW